MDEEKKAKARDQKCAWAAANPEQRREVQARYRAKNLEKIRKEAREWARKNRDPVKDRKWAAEYAAKRKLDPERLARYRANHSAWIKRNRAVLTQKAIERRRAKLDEYRASERAYRAANREKLRPIVSAVRIKRRAAKLRSVITATRADLDELRRKQKTCYYCGAPGKLTFDHIIPLSKGGEHSRDNLVMACASCNSFKGNRDPIAFAQSRGLLLV